MTKQWYERTIGQPIKIDLRFLNEATLMLTRIRQQLQLVPSDTLKGRARVDAMGVGADYDRDKFDDFLFIARAVPAAVPRGTNVAEMGHMHDQVRSLENFGGMAYIRGDDAYDTARAGGRWLGEGFGGVMGKIEEAATGGHAESQVALMMFKEREEARKARTQATDAKVERACQSSEEKIVNLARRNDELARSNLEKDALIEEMRHEIAALKARVGGTDRPKDKDKAPTGRSLPR